MPPGQFGEKTREKRTGDPGKKTNAASLLGNTDQTHKQRHDADEPEGEGDRMGTGFNNAVGALPPIPGLAGDHITKNVLISGYEGIAGARHQDRDQNKSRPYSA